MSSHFECWNNGMRRRAAHIQSDFCCFGGRNSEEPLIRNRNLLVKPRKEWCIGSKKKIGRRGAFVSHLHLVFPQPCLDAVDTSEVSLVSTAHAMIYATTHLRAVQHPSCGRVAHICCEEKVKVRRSQHTQSSQPDTWLLGKRERKPGTNIPTVKVFFW